MDNVGYRKIYRLRCAIPNAKSVEVTFPYEVVERQATINNMTVAEYIKMFEVVAEFNGFEGVHYTFKPRANEFPSNRAVIDLWEETSHKLLGKVESYKYDDVAWVKINVPIEITAIMMKIGCNTVKSDESPWQKFMDLAVIKYGRPD